METPPGECPARIGPFEIERELGRGGMGVVYLGRDTKLGRLVAIKLLPEDMARDPDRCARFEREARTAASLNHPNIATIYELGEYEGSYFIAMEYVDGCTLETHLGQGRCGTVTDLLETAEQILEGLAAAHRQNVVHRDLKPGNIMVTTGGSVKILDFGLAKGLDDQGPAGAPTALTMPGQLMGTVGYMSPEQARGLTVDARSDLFSFGALLYEMVTGVAPFRRDTVADTISAVLTTEAPPPSTRRANLPTELDGIVARLLHKDPQGRYQSAEEVLVDLRAVRPQATARPSSIAVLPFADMSPGRDQEYFCDGLAEELINALAQIEGLQVTARTSAFQFKDKMLDVRDIGRQLNVETILEGSVRRAGNRLRITAQLVSVADGYHLWSQRYDRDLEDIFAVQDEIARTIVETLEIKLVGDPAKPLVRSYTDNVAAYSLYLKGRHFWNNREQGYLLQSLECFDAAIENDPSYALAYAGLADSHSILGYYCFVPPEEAYGMALAAAERSVELDDTLAEGHVSLGVVKLWYEYDLQTAGRELERAIELNPKLGMAYSWYVRVLGASLRVEEALQYARRAQELDPLSPPISGTLGYALIWVGRYEEARQEAQRALEIVPNSLLSRWVLSVACSLLSMHDDAIATAQRAVELSKRNAFVLGVLASAYAWAGHRADALRIADQMKGLGEGASWGNLAGTFAILGDRDMAFSLLERAIEQRNPYVSFLKVMPDFGNLRDDPRFDEIVHRIGLG